MHDADSGKWLADKLIQVWRKEGKQDILELFRFIDWVLQLSEALEERYWRELNKFEEKCKMSPVFENVVSELH